MKWDNVFPEVPGEFRERVTATLKVLESQEKKRNNRERTIIMEHRVNHNAKRVYATLGGVMAAVMIVIFGGVYLVYSGILSGDSLREPYTPGNNGVITDEEVSKPFHHESITPEEYARILRLYEGLKAEQSELNRQYALYLISGDEPDRYYKEIESMKRFSYGFTDSVTSAKTTVTVLDVIGDNSTVTVFFEMELAEGEVFNEINLNLAGSSLSIILSAISDPPISYGGSMSAPELLAHPANNRVVYSVSFYFSKVEFMNVQSLELTLNNFLVNGHWEFAIPMNYSGEVIRDAFEYVPDERTFVTFTNSEITPLGFSVFYNIPRGMENPFGGKGDPYKSVLNYGLGEMYAEYLDGTVVYLYSPGGSGLSEGGAEVNYYGLRFNAFSPLDLTQIARIHIGKYVFEATGLPAVERIAPLITEEEAFAAALLKDDWGMEIDRDSAELVKTELRYNDNGTPWYSVIFRIGEDEFPTAVCGITGVAAKG